MRNSLAKQFYSIRSQHYHPGRTSIQQNLAYHNHTKNRYFQCISISHLHKFHPSKLQSSPKRRISSKTIPLLDTINKGTNHNHALFEEQLNELDAERTAYTIDTSSSSNSDSNTISSYEDELQEMNDERERLYGFTETERNAWTDLSSTNSKVDAEALMKEIHQIHESHQYKKHDDNNYNNDDDAVAFTHLTAEQTNVHMVDVGSKKVTRRTAHAQCKVVFPPNVMKAFEFQNRDSANDAVQEEMVGPKGPIFATAKLAGIMGAKKTSELIPLCHPLPLDKVSVSITLNTQTNTATIDCHCVVTHKTGVEMEAMTGASIAALTIYDMVKAVSHEVRVTEVVLVEKQGGKRLVKDGVLLN